MRSDQAIWREDEMSTPHARADDDLVSTLRGVLWPITLDSVPTGVPEAVIVEAGEAAGGGAVCAPGDLLLVVGVSDPAAMAEPVVAAAARARASGVVVRAAPGAEESFAAAGRRHRVAVLGVRADVSWTQLTRLIRGAAEHQAVAAAGDPLQPGNLFGFANLVADHVGGPTTIEDARSNVLAYSAHDHGVDTARQQTILGRRVPGDWVERLERDGAFRRIRDSDGVVRVEYPDEPGFRSRLAVAVRAGGDLLGTIWVSESDRPLDTRAEAALAEVARLAPLHLLRYHALEEIQRRRDEEILQRALAGDIADPGTVATLGITAQAYSSVVALAMSAGHRRDAGDGDGDGTLADVARTLHAVRLYGSSGRPPLTPTAIGGRVYVLVPEPKADGARGRRVAHDLVTRACAGLARPVRAAVGSTGRGLGHLRVSRDDADRVLRVMRDGDDPVAHVDDVTGRLTLMRLADLASGEPGLLTGRASRLADYDRTHHSDHVATLRAFLDANGDVRRAAQALLVHPNTRRYRLARLREAAGLDLNDPDERLVAHLQLRLMDDWGPVL
jgi:GAF domain-containing protein